MTSIDRRRLLALTAGAGAAPAARGFAQPPADPPRPAASPMNTDVTPERSNPHAARAHVFTVVTPDMAASLRFYRDLMGYEVIERGVLSAKRPTVAGVGGAGRPYALIRAPLETSEYGVVRLLAAPRGAAANRPRPTARITDPGLAVMECLTTDYRISYRRLAAAGVPTISRPLYYAFRDIKTLPGATPRRSDAIDVRSYSAFGPAGEQLFISCGVEPGDTERPRVLRQPRAGIHTPVFNFVILSLDRWPVWNFYKAAFGMTPVVDTHVANENVNTLIGAPPGTYYNYGQLGDSLSMEWWEYPAVDPRTAVTYPTRLDRTGFAMITLRVDDLAAVRALATSHGVPIIGEGSLPLPSGEPRAGFYLRGAVGELIEVVGRR